MCVTKGNLVLRVQHQLRPSQCEKERESLERENCRFSVLFCSSALYPSVNHNPICSKLRAELKRYNERFQVHSHLNLTLIRSDPHTNPVNFLSLWLLKCKSLKLLREYSASLLTTNHPWKCVLIHEIEG